MPEYMANIKNIFTYLSITEFRQGQLAMFYFTVFLQLSCLQVYKKLFYQ